MLNLEKPYNISCVELIKLFLANIQFPELPGWQLEHKPLAGKELSGNSTVMWCGRILFCPPLPVSLEGKISPDHLCLNLSGRWWVRFNCSPHITALLFLPTSVTHLSRQRTFWFGFVCTCTVCCYWIISHVLPPLWTVYKDGWHESSVTVSLSQQFSNALWRQSAVREQAPPPLL